MGEDLLPTLDAPCFLCGAADADPVWSTPDRALGVPGIYTVARCRSCGFLYQKPRVRDDGLVHCYPDHYPRHQEPSLRLPLKGSPSRVRAVQWALATGLNYPHFLSGRPGWLTRLRARLLLRRLRWNCLPWVGEGRYLDVGCGSGGSLGVAKTLGWWVAGIEMDEAAATKALRFTKEIHVGDIRSAPFPPGEFDLVTAFHVLEHVPDPVAVVRRMLDWLGPGGRLIIEVPNAGGLGASLFGQAWSGLELPRHLAQFTPRTLGGVVERAGGTVLWCWHQAKPRYYLRSVDYMLRDRGWIRLARLMKRPLIRGLLKLILEITLPLGSLARRGEVIRVGAKRAWT